MCEKLPKVGQAYMCILVVPHIYDAKYVHWTNIISQKGISVLVQNHWWNYGRL
jgi:hypothetical protein